MPKNKGKYKSQQPVSQTDVEPSEAVLDAWGRIGAKLAPHRTKLVAVIVAALVGLLGMGVWSYWSTRKAQSATRSYQAAIDVLSARLVDATPNAADLSALMGEDPEAPKFKTAEERGTAALTAFDTIAKDAGGSKVAKKARLLKAGVLFDLGRFDDAIALYREVSAEADDASLKKLAQEGLALSLEAKALAQKDAAARASGLDAALAEFKKLDPDAKGSYFDVALFHQARLLQLKGDKAAAVALYKQIVDTLPMSPMVGEARERLASLE